MKEIGNIVSICDGMSCGQIAINRAGLKYDKYYASEINKPAITVTQANYPNTIQMGDVFNVSGKDLPKAGLFLAGTPCQGFSIAGGRLQFDDPRSKVFFEAVRVLNECREKNPDIKFIFENVPMGLKNELVFSKYLGVDPIEIDSQLVSAQRRKRLYWTNINAQPYNLFGDIKPNIPLPADRGLVIRDIMESDVNEKYYLSQKVLDRILSSGKERISNTNEKGGTLTTRQNELTNDMLLIREVIQLNPSKESGGKQPYQQNRIYDIDGLNPCLTASLPGGANLIYGDSMDERVFDTGGKMQTLLSGRTDTKTKIFDSGRIRMPTEIECERLQTVPDNYTNHVAKTHRYAMLGNGWTVDVITHILSYL